MTDERELSAALRISQRPVLITGAGISVASGARAYRTGTDATWALISESWATREKMLEDIEVWWKTFGVQQRENLLGRSPNAAHKALVDLSQALPGLRIVTQNIDGLDRAAGQGTERFIEVHGTIERLMCFEETCAGWRGFAFAAGEKRAGGFAPRCPHCGHPARPLVLQFDEDYASHPAYRSFQAMTWIAEADLVVFMGTSNSISITAYAMRSARGRGVPIWSVNPVGLDGVTNVLGQAEQVLPRVVERLATGRAGTVGR
jgi:NAD-dependent deacetylase